MNDELNNATNIVEFQKALLSWMEASAGIYGFEKGLRIKDVLGILSTSIVDVCMKNDLSPSEEFEHMSESARRMERFKGLLDILKGALKNEEDTDTI